MKIIAVLSIVVIGCLSQRSPYLSAPIGYPVIRASTENVLAERFGEDAVSTVSPASTVSTTTVRLPIQALGDAELVNRLSKLPVDHQPFWLINWRALEEHRQNPKSYSQSTNFFIDNRKR